MSKNSLKLKGKSPFNSHPNLSYQSSYKLSHLNPNYKPPKSSLRKSQNSVNITMSNPRLSTNRHIATAHKLIDDLDEQETSFNSRLKNVLNAYSFQLALVTLVIMDCIMVLGEMIIELQLLSASSCVTSHGDHHSSSNMSSNLFENITDYGGHGSHNGGGHNLHEIAHASALTSEHSQVSYRPGPSHKHQHILEHFEEAFHITSICILFLFNLDFVVRFFAFGYKYFMHWEVTLDAIIVFVSFWLDVAFLLDRSLKNLLYLLIILRMWRVLRIIHAIVTAIKTPYERQIEKLKKKRRILQRDLAKAYFYSNMLEEEIKKLRKFVEILEKVDGDEDQPPSNGTPQVNICDIKEIFA